MLALILKRLLLAIPTAIAITALLFVCVVSLLGSPATLMLGDEATPAAVHALNQKYGFDQPVYVQYFRWVNGAMHGELGRSFATQQNVTDVVAAALPVTIELALWSVTLAAGSAVALGTIPVARRLITPAVTFVSIIGITVPNFMLGVCLIYVFSVVLGILPSTGWVPWESGVLIHIKHIAMPVVTLAAYYFGVFSIMYRSEYQNIEQRLFVQVAKAKGLSDTKVAFVHALPNAILPVITFIGISMGQLTGGAVITETVYSMPGIGRLFVSAIASKDFPVMLAIGMIIIVGVILMNLLADLIYTVVNPQIRMQ